MKKILTSLVAAGVLVAGGATAAVVAGPSASAQEGPEEATQIEHPDRGSAVQEVLDDLVATGEITQEQADTIAAALQDKWEELRAEHADRRFGPGFRRGFKRGFRVGSLLDDGVIDADELAALPEGHVLTDPEGPFAEVAADGEITVEELRSVVRELRESGEFGLRSRFGGGFPSVEGSDV